MHRTTYPFANPHPLGRQGAPAHRGLSRASGALPPRTPPTSDTRNASPAPLALDHHLWRNGRLWWIAVTLRDVKGRRRRVRRSLGTDDEVDARWQRDRFLDRVRREAKWTIADPALQRAATSAEVAA